MSCSPARSRAICDGGTTTPATPKSSYNNDENEPVSAPRKASRGAGPAQPPHDTPARTLVVTALAWPWAHDHRPRADFPAARCGANFLNRRHPDSPRLACPPVSQRAFRSRSRTHGNARGRRDRPSGDQLRSPPSRFSPRRSAAARPVAAVSIEVLLEAGASP